MSPTTTLTDNNLLKSIKRIQDIKLDNALSYTIVDYKLALSDIIDTLTDLPVTPLLIYVDLKGINLSRHGTISILQLYVLLKDYTYLVDVHQLRHAAFSTTRRHSGKCLKAILEAEDIPKVFFDVRNDLDALFYYF
jgi:exonuclease 3'-5' domain-containing protein 1